MRNFKNKPVPRELLHRILDGARFAPTAKNTQELRWIVLETREQTEKLAALVIDWLRALPEIDPATAKDVHAESLVRAWEAGYDVITRTAPQIALIVAPKGHWGPADASIAAAYLELLAHGHKVGCCWGGYVCFAMPLPSAAAMLGSARLSTSANARIKRFMTVLLGTFLQKNEGSFKVETNIRKCQYFFYIGSSDDVYLLC